MAAVAIYSLKGGVGKTTLSVNLAWSAAVRSARRTLLWDLDGQAAATFLVGDGKTQPERAEAVLSRHVTPDRLIRRTATPRLDLLPADTSLRGLDRMFHSFGKKRRLAKLSEALALDYDRVLLDCPPGLTETSDQVIRAAALVLVPVIPSPLAMRAFEEVVDHLVGHHRHAAPVLPVFNMADRRRAVHRAALAAHPDWPVIPMASTVEAMSVHHRPVGAFAASSAAASALDALWITVERRLAERVH